MNAGDSDDRLPATMPASQISGVLTAMATPFAEDGSVDFEAARGLARHLVETGSHGLVVAGTTGESPTLDDREKLDLLAAVIDEVGGGATVVCGTGSNDTRHTVELTRAAAESGADAALVVAPYYNRPNRAGITAHFRAAAEAAPELPVIVYNIPSRVVVNLPADHLAELAEIDNVVAVKQANDAELEPVDGLALLAGNDGTFLRALELGGAGGILVASHLVGPAMRRIWELARSGDIAAAREANAELERLYEALGIASNPIPLKAALEMAGLDSGRLRLPLVPATDSERRAVREAMQGAGALGAGA